MNGKPIDEPVHLQEGDSVQIGNVLFRFTLHDPSEAPSTGTVVRGGLNWREAHYCAEAACSSGTLFAMDLVEVNPTLAPGKDAELTTALGNALIASALGSRIL